MSSEREGSSLGTGREGSTVQLQGQLARRGGTLGLIGADVSCCVPTAQGDRLCGEQQLRKRACRGTKPDGKVLDNNMMLAV